MWPSRRWRRRCRRLLVLRNAQEADLDAVLALA
jgi:hypothetical protein